MGAGGNGSHRAVMIIRRLQPMLSQGMFGKDLALKYYCDSREQAKVLLELTVGGNVMVDR
ncbi:hypothetical protein GCM10011611_64620 [Aliidongia dinghuensis]|uniref:Uncharacterized protein n=1 Tax=Aliidongia dinghuensis TaxID=1867774 RepID=A0A8J2Z1A0_9PROT|nr:hypothetical protein GCM10011611_64620 [Aliidongia dinghuensis]